jgi:hypothetical protein
MVLDLLSFNFRQTDKRDASFAQPLRQRTQGFERIRLMRLKDNADAFDRGLGHGVGV